MEKQGSRYRNNNRRKQILRKKEIRKRRMIVAAVIIVGACIIIFLGYLFYCVFLRDDGAINGTTAKPAVSENIQETTANETGKIGKEELSEIIDQAEKRLQEDGEDASLEKLKQRVQEAKELVKQDATGEEMGVAYLNLILAINDLNSD